MTSYPSATSPGTRDPSTGSHAPPHPRSTIAEQTGRSLVKEPTPVVPTAAAVRREQAAHEHRRPRFLIHRFHHHRLASLPPATASASSHSSSPPKSSGGLFASPNAQSKHSRYFSPSASASAPASSAHGSDLSRRCLLR